MLSKPMSNSVSIFLLIFLTLVLYSTTMMTFVSGDMSEECKIRPIIHLLRYPGCVPKPIPSFACQGQCSSYVQVRHGLLFLFSFFCVSSPKWHFRCNKIHDHHVTLWHIRVSLTFLPSVSSIHPFFLPTHFWICTKSRLRTFSSVVTLSWLIGRKEGKEY